MLVDGHATEQNIVHRAVLLNENFMPVNTPLSPTIVSDTEPLFIANPNILLLPRPSTPYPVYPGPPLLTYSELQKCCNVWQFWIACDVALYSIGITLSIVEMK